MDKGAVIVGIDVSKDRLDVHVLPTDEAFAVARDGEGLSELVARLKALSPGLVAVEATGGFETTTAAAVDSTLLLGLEKRMVVVGIRMSLHFSGKWPWQQPPQPMTCVLA